MKKISSSVYENLTPRQRVVASVEALARGDEPERQRLISSCPKKTYMQTDMEYSEAMERLMKAAMAVEADLRECVIGFLIAIRVDPKNSRSFLQNFADIRDAWNSTVMKMGIDENSMASAGPPPCSFFELIEDLLPEPDRQKVEKLAVALRDILDPST